MTSPLKPQYSLSLQGHVTFSEFKPLDSRCSVSFCYSSRKTGVGNNGGRGFIPASFVLSLEEGGKEQWQWKSYSIFRSLRYLRKRTYSAAAPAAARVIVVTVARTNLNCNCDSRPSKGDRSLRPFNQLVLFPQEFPPRSLREVYCRDKGRFVSSSLCVAKDQGGAA